MTKLLSIALASTFAVAGTAALAADPPKGDASAKTASAKLEKPANVTADAWTKMTDAEKKKAVDAARTPATKEAAAKPKKEKKGGC
jgi:hypothetical protein